MTPRIKLDGRVALITGAGGGLGRAHAIELARRGAKVVVNDLGGGRDGNGATLGPAESVVAEIKEAGGEAIANGDSVADRKGAQNMVTQAVEAFGRLDIVINNAGILRDKTFSKMDLDDFDLVVQVHLLGSAYVTHAAWPIMREQKYGRVIMTTSSSGLYGNFGQSNYGAAKMGLVGLMNCLKLEGARDNIRINCLAPTAWSRMTSDLMPPEAAAFFTPNAVAAGIVSLCGEDAPNGMILEAGAGYFSKVAVVEGRGAGLYLDASAELVAEKWSEITDMTGARSFGAAPEVSNAILSKYNAGQQ
jgi:NAD(P)-dependent dehydrogenase (short-subunit alcohol dehydrogenase family)